MSLFDEIKTYKKDFVNRVPKEAQEVMAKATEKLLKSDILEKAPKVGDKLKQFDLSNQLNKKVSLSSVLEKGPAIITFYRGGWCPYCNLELRAYQNILPEIQARGASLIAISPEKPDSSLSTIEKNEMTFDVLSDIDAKYAKEIGIVFNLDESLRPIYKQFGIEIEKHNGKDQFYLPLAATFVVNKQGEIISSFVDADYTKRQEPEDVIKALDSI